MDKYGVVNPAEASTTQARPMMAEPTQVITKALELILGYLLTQCGIATKGARQV